MAYRPIGIVVVATVLTSLVAASTESGWFGSEFSVVQRVYGDCSTKNDMVGCLKGRALEALTKAAQADKLSVLEGVDFVKVNTTDEPQADAAVDARFMDGLTGIDKALANGLNRFFQTHSLRFAMSEGRGKIHDKIEEIKEKRGKKKFGGGGGGGDKGGKKYGRYVMAALLTAMGIAGPLGLKALAAIAGKALVISKVALTIAGIIALKKIFQSDHHEETSFQVHSSGDHNRRNAYMLRTKGSPSQYVDPYRYYYEHYPQASSSTTQ